MMIGEGSELWLLVGIAHTHPEYQRDDEHNQGVLHNSLAIFFQQEFIHWMDADR